MRTPDFLAYIAFHVVSILHMFFFLGSARRGNRGCLYRQRLSILQFVPLLLLLPSDPSNSAQLDALTGGAGVSLVQVLGITLPLGFFCQVRIVGWRYLNMLLLPGAHACGPGEVACVQSV